MKSATLSRLESLLEAKHLDGTLTRSWLPEAGTLAMPSGVPTVDRMLGGGWRRGEVSEITGARSSGRTSVLIATLAAATAEGGVVGLVDAVDRFDPVSAAAAGLDLDRVLWVRGPSLTVESARPDVIAAAVHRGIRALDLIVRAGGFAVAALDVADVPARHLRALPWTTWLRLAHANEGRDTVCLLVGETPMGKSARGASIRLDAAHQHQWTGVSAQSRRFGGIGIKASLGAGCWVPEPATPKPEAKAGAGCAEPCTLPAEHNRRTWHPAPAFASGFGAASSSTRGSGDLLSRR